MDAVTLKGGNGQVSFESSKDFMRQTGDLSNELNEIQ